jgi:phasin family protein
MNAPNIEQLGKAASETMTQSGKAVHAGFQDLAHAYQELASKNAEKFNASFKSLSAVKTPTEFIELQQKLVKEAFETALADSQKIADLTVTVFKTAFEPIQKQIEAAQKYGKK